MFKAKRKFISLLTACMAFVLMLVMGIATMSIQPKTASAAEKTATLSIVANTGTVSGKSISWTDGVVTFINNQGSSTTAIRTSDSDHYRVYANSNGSIKTNNKENIKKIVITCTQNPSNCKDSFGDIATVSSSVVTITPTQNVTEVTFTAGAQWRLKKIVVTYEENVGGCAHTNTTTTTVDANCTENGSVTVTCDDCGNEVSKTNISATGHNYNENKICTVCGQEKNEWKLLTDVSLLEENVEVIIVANGYDKALSTAQKTNNRGVTTIKKEQENTIVTFDTTDVQFLTIKNGTVDGTFAFYTGSGYLYAASSSSNYLKTQTSNNANGSWKIEISKEGVATITAQGNNTRNILKYNDLSDLFSCYESGQQAVAIYYNEATVPEEPTPEEPTAKIVSASLTIGSELTVNYYVTMSEEYVGAIMYFTMGDSDTTYDVAGVLAEDGRYVYSFGVAPQFMAENIAAELKFGEEVLDSMLEYSVKTYAEHKLNGVESPATKQLISAMLYYGAAAQNYTGYNTDNLVTNGFDFEGFTAVSPETTDFDLVNGEKIDDKYPAWFTAAGVYFDNVNQIYVKVNTTEKVTITATNGNGEVVELTQEGTKFSTTGILATGFDETYTFVLSYDGVVMQTLTYSVNAYAYAMKGHTTMGELALALYNYGVAAQAFANAQ